MKEKFVIKNLLRWLPGLLISILASYFIFKVVDIMFCINEYKKTPNKMVAETILFHYILFIDFKVMRYVRYIDKIPNIRGGILIAISESPNILIHKNIKIE